MHITLKDIAEQTGFSITTVSRALAGYSDVNAGTRQQILDVAKSLGYQPNLLARQLRNQRTQTIGIIIPAHDHSFSNDFFGELLRGIGDAAARFRHDVLISAQPAGEEEEMSAYQRVVGGNRVDGMILARTRRNDTRISYLQQHKHPFVVSGRNAPGEPSDFAYVDVDSQLGIKMATAHFLELGHRHIGLILPPPDIAFTEYRHTGYRQALDEAGISYQPDYVIYGDLMRSGGYQCGKTLLEKYSQITAVVASNDLMALGAMSAVQGCGLQVGEDVAICGFDDIPAAEYALPALTTVHQPIYDIGQRLVQMLLSLITQPEHLPQVILEPTLVIRASSGSSRR